MNRINEADLQEIIARRVANTGETPAQARKAILAVTSALNAGKLVLEVFDDDGITIGYRDKDGYHPNGSDPSRRGQS